MQLICQYFNIPLTEVDNHIATKHKVKIDRKSSRYFKPYSETHICNSYHKYALKRVDEKL